MRKPLSFIKSESASGLLLVLVVAIAMVVANSLAADTYFQILKTVICGLSIQHWINDGLMAIFFFLVGLEIKREILGGELRQPRKAALPILAAMGGMIVPALVYSFLQKGSTAGWAIPMATDIAFALGALSLLGNRVPSSLKLFLLSLAIADDLGAVIVIATFYTKEIRVLGFVIAGLSTLGILVAQRFSLKSYFCYIPLAIILWIGVLYSGIHASIAGVFLAFLTPYRFKVEKHSAEVFSPLEDLIRKIHPWVNLGVIPIFALANAGIVFAHVSIDGAYINQISMGVFLGLVIGKPLGIMSFSALAVFSKLAALPNQVRWVQLLGVSCIAGIGFTMSIFLANLSLTSVDLNLAKISVLAASITSAVIGIVILKSIHSPQLKKF